MQTRPKPPQRNHSLRKGVLGLMALSLALHSGCTPLQGLVLKSGPPEAGPASALSQVSPDQAPAPLLAAPARIDQENNAAAVAALGQELTAISAQAATSEDVEPVAADGRPSPQLIGPLLDPLFEPSLEAEPEAYAELEEMPAEELTEEQFLELAGMDDSADPFLSGEFEPLDTEDIPLPGPNDFGTLDGAQVDTSNIGDLTEFSDLDTQYDLPVVMNEQVKFFIDQYQTSHRKVFARWLARSGRFLPLIQEELAKAGLPQDLCYLPMIESGFRVNAYSPAKAVGAWQFIQSTGKMYDLTINKEIDERCDPVKSTRAAIRFLSDLYDDFQSWPLAIAAYNAGGGRIRTAVEKTGSTDFWELAKSRYLVSETKYYVPKLMAAIIVAKNPEKYGFTDIEYEEPLAFETVRVPKATHLAAVALAAGTHLDDIYNLNRHLRRAVTPSSQKYCELCVPVGTSELITQNLPLVRTTVTTKFKTHVVKKKDTAARISKKYGINQKTLLKVNRLRTAKLKPGLRLQIPYQVKSYQLTAKSDRRVAAAPAPPDQEISREPIRHRVRPGESLYQLARRYNVTVEKIAAWNKLSDPRRLSVGQTLAIYADNRTATQEAAKVVAAPEERLATNTPPSFYEVRNGDTLFDIARKFQTTPEKIRELNSLDGNTIHPGLRLRLGNDDDGNA